MYSSLWLIVIGILSRGRPVYLGKDKNAALSAEWIATSKFRIALLNLEWCRRTVFILHRGRGLK